MKKRKCKSAVPIYLSAAVWLLLGLLCPGILLKGWGFIAAALLSAAAYLLSSRKCVSTRLPGRHKCVDSKENPQPHSTTQMDAQKQTAQAGN